MAKKKKSVLSEFDEATIGLIRGVLLEHEYVMEERLGLGGFSVVYRVQSQKFGRSFAAKITNVNSARHKSALQATANEEQALSLFDHPHIIRLYDSFRFDTYSILILELCTGRSIKDLIIESRASKAPIPNLGPLIAAIVDALAYIHANHYVHRDIKPANILLDSYGRPKVADFGMCIPWNESELLTEHLGSAGYFSPELFERKPFNPYKADVWALGITLYEMAMGMLKWSSDINLVADAIVNGGILVKRGTPPDVANFVRAMTNMNPDHRPSMETLAGFMPMCKFDQEKNPPKKFRDTGLSLVGLRRWNTSRGQFAVGSTSLPRAPSGTTVLAAIPV
jgi:serine/threonine protein kinase